MRRPAIAIGQRCNTHVLRRSHLPVEYAPRQPFRIAVYTFNINGLPGIFFSALDTVAIPLIVHLQIDVFSRSVVIRRTRIAILIVLWLIRSGHARSDTVPIALTRHAHCKTLNKCEIRTGQVVSSTAIHIGHTIAIGITRVLKFHFQNEEIVKPLITPGHRFARDRNAVFGRPPAKNNIFCAVVLIGIHVLAPSMIQDFIGHARSRRIGLQWRAGIPVGHNCSRTQSMGRHIDLISPVSLGTIGNIVIHRCNICRRRPRPRIRHPVFAADIGQHPYTFSCRQILCLIFLLGPAKTVLFAEILDVVRASHVQHKAIAHARIRQAGCAARTSVVPDAALSSLIAEPGPELSSGELSQILRVQRIDLKCPPHNHYHQDSSEKFPVHITILQFSKLNFQTDFHFARIVLVARGFSRVAIQQKLGIIWRG